MNDSAMKTIVYVGGFELPDKNAAAQCVVSNAKILRDLSYNVVLLDTCRDQNAQLVPKQVCFGFERWSIGRSIKQLYAIDKIVKVMQRQPNLFAVIAYNYPSIGLSRLRRYCARHHIKLFADVTEWYGPQGDTIIHRCMKALDSYYRMEIVHPRLDGIIAISHYLENFYKNKTKTVFLPPLIDLEEEKWKQSAQENQKDGISLLYTGVPGKHKDKLNLILRALSQCDQTAFFLKIIGITEKQYLSYYLGAAKMLKNLKNKVCFLGRMAHMDVIRELKAADFSLFGFIERSQGSRWLDSQPSLSNRLQQAHLY